MQEETLTKNPVIQNDTVSADTFTGSAPIEFSQPQETPIFPVAGLSQISTPPLQATESEIEASKFSKNIQGLEQELLGESGFRTEQEDSQGVSAEEITIRDLRTRGKAIEREALSIPFQTQEEFTGRASVRQQKGVSESRLRQNAIQALSNQSLLEAAQGNLATALDLADRAVAQKYDPIRERIAAEQANLDRILESPEFSRQDKNRAQRQKDAKDNQLLELDQQIADEQEKKGVGADVASRGGGALLLRKIEQAPNSVEALRIATEAGFGGAVEKEQDQFTLSKGQIRFDAEGNVIARGVTEAGEPPSSQPIVSSSGDTLVYGTPEYIVERLKQTSASKTKPVASEREQLGKFSGVIAQTSNLITTLSGTDTDPIIGALRAYNPYDFDARAVNAQIQALVPGVARGVYGEVGVLTDQDIERYLLTLPNLKSTAEQNKFVGLMTLTNAMRSYEETLLNMANSNVNVSGFVDSYENISRQVAELEDELNVGQSEITTEDLATFEDVVGVKSGGNYFSNLWGSLFGR